MTATRLPPQIAKPRLSQGGCQRRQALVLALAMGAALLLPAGTAVLPSAAARGAVRSPAAGARTHAMPGPVALSPADAGDTALSWNQPVVADRTTPYQTTSYLESVSCVTGPLCAAVDASGSVVTSTDPAGGAATWTVTAVGTAPLFAISCASASLCVAGAEPDDAGQGSVAVSTHPTRGTAAWQVDVVPSLQNVAGVSCPAVSLCVAVTPGNQVLVSTHPAGGASAWKLFTVPEVSAGYGMVAVSCPATTLCVGVDGAGNVYTSTDPAGGASAWKHTSTLGTAGSQNFVDYRGLSCASVKLCLVILSSTAAGGAVLASTTNPRGGSKAWTQSTSTVITPEEVSCAHGPICVLPSYIGSAAGFAVSTDPTQPLSEWGTQTGGNPSYGPANAVSCTGTSLCAAVDSGGDVITATQPAGGAWTTVQADGSTPLTGVSCPSPLLCVAVGDTGVLLTGTKPYDPASTWSPADVDGSVDLTGVSCASVSLCVATDTQGEVLTSTNPTGGASAWKPAALTSLPLTAVSCTAAPLCVATDDDGGVYTATHPAGGASAWKHTAVTGSGGGGNVPPAFTAISCTTAPLCVATDFDGDVITSTDPTGGAAGWTVSYLGFSSNLTGVSCVTSGACAATYSSGQVATSSDPTGGEFGWSVSDPVASPPGLNAIRCTDAGLCVAVGSGELDAPQPGGSWTANQVDSTSDMTAVDCIGDTVGTALCVAVDAAGRVLAATPPHTYFNWAGYLAHKTGVTFTGVHASWTEPKLTCPSGSGSTSSSSIWIGLDDVKTIEQAGVEADCTGPGQSYYYAWYELYPAANVPLPLTIHPGNHIEAGVEFTGGDFVFTLTDKTTGKTYTSPPQPDAQAKRATAEWIIEDPSWSYGVPLADFGTAHLTGASATGNGHTGTISDPSWTSQAITMNTGYSPGSGGTPSALTGHGADFSLSWR